MKYIVFLVDGPLPMRAPFVFPNLLVHADVEARTRPLLEKQFKAPAYVISAGDVTLYGDDVQCSGKSETLGVVSLKDEDTLLLKMNDYGIAHTF